MAKAKQKLLIDVEGYCVKCREKRVMDEPRATTMKNGNPGAKGTCPECGTGMFKILPKS